VWPAHCTRRLGGFPSGSCESTRPPPRRPLRRRERRRCPPVGTPLLQRDRTSWRRGSSRDESAILRGRGACTLQAGSSHRRGTTSLRAASHEGTSCLLRRSSPTTQSGRRVPSSLPRRAGLSRAPALLSHSWLTKDRLTLALSRWREPARRAAPACGRVPVDRHGWLRIALSPPPARRLARAPANSDESDGEDCNIDDVGDAARALPNEWDATQYKR
jgi:hypothetical protein